MTVLGFLSKLKRGFIIIIMIMISGIPHLILINWQFQCHIKKRKNPFQNIKQNMLIKFLFRQLMVP